MLVLALEVRVTRGRILKPIAIHRQASPALFAAALGQDMAATPRPKPITQGDVRHPTSRDPIDTDYALCGQ